MSVFVHVRERERERGTYIVHSIFYGRNQKRSSFTLPLRTCPVVWEGLKRHRISVYCTVWPMYVITDESPLSLDSFIFFSTE